MEVEATNFWPCLLPLLKDIANAEFISIDVEMSGISTRNRNSPNDRSQEPRKPSLQEQYLETKAAAELYQVLQFGLTCVEEDHEHSKY
jgi:poly(A)-specific ribonuclease